MRFDSLRASRLYWLSGLALAAIGVLLARLVAPTLEGRAGSLVTLTGQLVALGGLVTICFGVRRRVWHSQAPEREELKP